MDRLDGPVAKAGFEKETATPVQPAGVGGMSSGPQLLDSQLVRPAGIEPATCGFEG